MSFNLYAELTGNVSSMKQRQSRTLFSRPWLSLFQFLRSVYGKGRATDNIMIERFITMNCLTSPCKITHRLRCTTGRSNWYPQAYNGGNFVPLPRLRLGFALDLQSLLLLLCYLFHTLTILAYFQAWFVGALFGWINERENGIGSCHI